MLKLTDRKWGKFCIGNLFKISTGANISNDKLSSGCLPRISAKDETNGITAFTSDGDIKMYRLNENCVSVSFLGSVFYQPYLASYDMKIHSLRIKGKEMNCYVGLFIVAECKRQFMKFTYGDQLSSSDLPKQYLLLPVAEGGEPDWAFMEAYMRQVEQEILRPAIEKLKERIIDAPKPEGGGKWKAFVISDLFRVRIGKNIDGNKADRTGNVAYITRKETNNGLEGFIKGKDSFLNEEYPVITIGNETSKPFIQKYPFFTGTKVNIMTPKERLSPYVLQFIVTSLEQHRITYSYSFTINSRRLKKQTILLPITNENKPDWQYMEDYMKYIEQQQLRSVIDAMEKRL